MTVYYAFIITNVQLLIENYLEKTCVIPNRSIPNKPLRTKTIGCCDGLVTVYYASHSVNIG
jgi:hypothetical protein